MDCVLCLMKSPPPMPDLNHSRPLDVHVWSDHPEVNVLVNELWERFFCQAHGEVEKRGRKPKATLKSQMKVLLLDLYVCWQLDPTQYIAVHLSKSGWKANSRYNALHLSSRLIDIIKDLHGLGFLDLHLGFEGRLTRMRAAEKLQLLFTLIKLPHDAILFNHLREPLELRQKDDTDNTNEKVEYEETLETIRMRASLQRYNALLARCHIDICSLEEPLVERTVSSGKAAGRKQLLAIDRRNIFVKRVFNNGSWEKGGRYYGGWWQGIGKHLRHNITINNKPTIEIDFKAMHVALLFAATEQKAEFDPYFLEERLLFRSSPKEQRAFVKQLVLVALNSHSKQQAFRAFRSDQPKGSQLKHLKDAQLDVLLTTFTSKHPQIEPYICSGKGLELMYLDSCIAEQVIDHFTDQDIPVLCIHDSFIIQYDHVLELRTTMVKAASSVTSRYLFTDKEGYGLDEWLKEVENTGVRPEWEPKTVIRCEGYNRRWSDYRRSLHNLHSITST